MQKLYEIKNQIKKMLIDGHVKPQPFWQQIIWRLIRVVYAVIGDMSTGQLSMRAMSLVYTTLITLVPLLALSFSVLKGFGAHNQVEPFLMNVLEPLGADGEEIAARIILFVDNIKVGVLGAVGLSLLIYSVIALMQKIEKAFNFIWRVNRPRSMAQRFSDYLSALLIGPLFIFLSAGLTTSMNYLPYFEQLGLSYAAEQLIQIIGFIVPYLIMTLAFTAIFIFMPNTKVKFGPAFIGGLFSAFMWKAMGFLFSTLIAGSASYVAIYAAFATLIIFMIWIYLAWLVLLIGSSIAFYTQHPRYVLAGYEGISLSNRMKEKVGLMILYYIGRDFERGKNQWDSMTLSHKINMPVIVINEMLTVLTQGNILAKTSENMATYVPAIPFDKTSIDNVLKIIREYGEKALVADSRLKPEKKLDQILKKYERVMNQTFGSIKISDLWK